MQTFFSVARLRTDKGYTDAVLKARDTILNEDGLNKPPPAKKQKAKRKKEEDEDEESEANVNVSVPPGMTPNEFSTAAKILLTTHPAEKPTNRYCTV